MLFRYEMHDDVIFASKGVRVPQRSDWPGNMAYRWDRHGQTVEMKQLSTRIGRLRACGDNGGKAARTFLRGHIYDHTIEIIDPHWGSPSYF